MWDIEGHSRMIMLGLTKSGALSSISSVCVSKIMYTHTPECVAPLILVINGITVIIIIHKLWLP